MFDWGPILTYFMKSGSIIYFWRYNNANGTRSSVESFCNLRGLFHLNLKV